MVKVDQGKTRIATMTLLYLHFTRRKQDLHTPCGIMDRRIQTI